MQKNILVEFQKFKLQKFNVQPLELPLFSRRRVCTFDQSITVTGQQGQGDQGRYYFRVTRNRSFCFVFGFSLRLRIYLSVFCCLPVIFFCYWWPVNEVVFNKKCFSFVMMCTKVLQQVFCTAYVKLQYYHLISFLVQIYLIYMLNIELTFGLCTDSVIFTEDNNLISGRYLQQINTLINPANFSFIFENEFHKNRKAVIFGTNLIAKFSLLRRKWK